MAVDDLRRYLMRLGLGFELTDSPVDLSGIPYFVKAGNEWIAGSLLGSPCVLAFAKQRHDAPDSVLVHWRSVKRVIGERAVLVLRSADDEFCRVLDREGVAYVMPGVRISIPGVVQIVTREAAGMVRLPKGRLTVNAQVAILWYLLHGNGKSVLFSELLEGPGLSKNRITDVGKELELAGLARVDKAWKAHSLVFVEEKRGLWERALPLMVSPIQSRIRVKNPPSGLARAGILALSDRTMLCSDAVNTFAISRMDERIASFVPLKYEGDVVEIWKYDPARLSTDPAAVDDLSLYLTLKDDPDARVQGELKALLEGRKW